MSQWIWKFGEMEIYHSLLLHNRRQQYGYAEPPVWKIYSPDSAVAFRKRVKSEGGSFRIIARGSYAVRFYRIDHKPWPENEKTMDSMLEGGEYLGEKREVWPGRSAALPAGEWIVEIRVSNPFGLPSLYVDGCLESDGSWLADDLTGHFEPVGVNAIFCDPDFPPDRFPFEEHEIKYLSVEKAGDGLLYDFGRETFAAVSVSGLPDQQKEIRVYFGESGEEALDGEQCVVRYRTEPEDGRIELPASAFRYIRIEPTGQEENIRLTALEQTLKLEERGAFRTSGLSGRIWRTAADTFRLNCREFFLDGIKRDRWVWSGDAYQSLFINRYLYFDADIERRTLTALAGKEPFRSHINGINDYTFFWFISLYEHYITYGDAEYLKQIYPQGRRIMSFCRERVSPDGLVRQQAGDWIFIDWAPMDKRGAVCGEQILFAKALDCWSRLCRVLGTADDGCGEQAAELFRRIPELYFDREKGAFVDCYESDLRMVTRQTNLLAYLFLPLEKHRKEEIYGNVILNDAVPPITTPYFKFFENLAHCREGRLGLLEQSIREYYGGMLNAGATTFFEAYTPGSSGAELYAMYGRPFEKSLCHAWSAGPVFLYGAYFLGVRNTGIGYDSFEVVPYVGEAGEICGSVPVPGGRVTVWANNRRVCVKSDISGGILRWGGRELALEAGREVSLDRD